MPRDSTETLARASLAHTRAEHNLFLLDGVHPTEPTREPGLHTTECEAYRSEGSIFDAILPKTI